MTASLPRRRGTQARFDTLSAGRRAQAQLLSAPANAAEQEFLRHRRDELARPS